MGKPRGGVYRCWAYWGMGPFCTVCHLSYCCGLVLKLIAGGADSTILRWDVTDGQLAEGRFAGPPLVVRSSLPDRGHCIRSLDYDPARDTVLVGTNQCDVMEVADNYQVEGGCWWREWVRGGVARGRGCSIGHCRDGQGCGKLQ